MALSLRACTREVRGTTWRGRVTAGAHVRVVRPSSVLVSRVQRRAEDGQRLAAATECRPDQIAIEPGAAGLLGHTLREARAGAGRGGTEGLSPISCVGIAFSSIPSRPSRAAGPCRGRGSTVRPRTAGAVDDHRSLCAASTDAPYFTEPPPARSSTDPSARSRLARLERPERDTFLTGQSACFQPFLAAGPVCDGLPGASRLQCSSRSPSPDDRSLLRAAGDRPPSWRSRRARMTEARTPAVKTSAIAPSV